MKKFIVVLVAFFAFAISVCDSNADELRIERESQYQIRVMEVGFKILNANQINKRVTFYYAPTKTVNAVAYASTKQVQIYKGLLPFVANDDELAGIISHEIAHCVDYHSGYGRRFSMAYAGKKFEIKADKTAIDYMVNAGYNPVAYIAVMNKISGEPNWFERSSSHPSGTERLNYMYEYIYSKYPEYLVDNEYKNNLYYQNFLLTSKDFRKMVKKKYEKLETMPVNNKKESRAF